MCQGTPPAEGGPEEGPAATPDPQAGSREASQQPQQAAAAAQQQPASSSQLQGGSKQSGSAGSLRRARGGRQGGGGVDSVELIAGKEVVGRQVRCAAAESVDGRPWCGLRCGGRPAAGRPGSWRSSCELAG